MIIYAATNGYLDDLPLDQVSTWELAFYRYMDTNHQVIVSEIVEKSIKGREKMSKPLLERLSAAIEQFKKTAAPSSGKH